MTPPETADPLWKRVTDRLGVDLRSGEGRLAATLFATFFLITTFQTTTKTLRQSAFLEVLGASRLPLVYLLVALLSYPILRLYSRGADRLPLRRLIQVSNLAVAVLLFGFLLLFGRSQTWVPVAFYVTTSIVYAMLISQFWSLANHQLNARQARRLFGFVGAGGILGGITGGQVARWSAVVEPTSGPLIASALALIGVALLLQFAPATRDVRGATARLGKLEKAQGGFEVLRRSAQLRWIAALMVLSVIASQVIDLQFNWVVESRTTNLAERTAFFGNFFSAMGVLAFIVQLGITGRIHRSLGVGVAMRALPGTLLIGSVALLVTAGWFPGLLVGVALALKVGENSLKYSIDQATRELLFLPVPTRLRTQAKAYIDVFLQRGAKGVAALLLLPVTLGWMTAIETGWISLVIALVWLGITVHVYRSYVDSFRTRLSHRKDGNVRVDLEDPVTLELVMQAVASNDPLQVLHGLDILAAHGRPDLVPSLLLYHDDPRVRGRALSVLARLGRHDAIPLMERRLSDEDPDVRAEAIRVLADLKGQDVCELMHPRLAESDPGVRAAAVACLTEHGDQALRADAHRVLVELHGSDDPIARCESARAIGAIREPHYREELIALLYDPHDDVVRIAIGAVHQRLARDGTEPIYLATLISLLSGRRAKLEARSALVAYGDRAVPGLEHFLIDPDEAIWVRRAVPRVLELIGTPRATLALLISLGSTRDLFTRRKIIQALRTASHLLDRSEATLATVAAAVASEAKGYLECLARLHSLNALTHADCAGPQVEWRTAAVPGLLDRVLADRAHERLRNLFGLLALVHDAKDIEAASRAMLGTRARPRAHALEYLDHELTGDLRQSTLAAVDDTPIREKLRRAWRLFGIPVASRQSTLLDLLAAQDPNDAEGHSLVLAALYEVHTDRALDLHRRVGRLAAEATSSRVRETASWVLDQTTTWKGPGEGYDQAGP